MVREGKILKGLIESENHLYFLKIIQPLFDLRQENVHPVVMLHK